MFPAASDAVSVGAANLAAANVHRHHHPSIHPSIHPPILASTFFFFFPARSTSGDKKFLSHLLYSGVEVTVFLIGGCVTLCALSCLAVVLTIRFAGKGDFDVVAVGAKAVAAKRKKKKRMKGFESVKPQVLSSGNRIYLTFQSRRGHDIRCTAPASHSSPSPPHRHDIRWHRPCKTYGMIMPSAFSPNRRSKRCFYTYTDVSWRWHIDTAVTDSLVATVVPVSSCLRTGAGSRDAEVR